MTIEQRVIFNKKEINKQRQRERRFVKANAVLKAIRRHPELHDILDHEGIRNSRQFPDAIQIDLASGSVTSALCLDFLFYNANNLSSKARKDLLQIGKDRQRDNLVSKIWSRSSLGVRITSKPGDGTRMGNRLEAYERLIAGRF